MEADRRLRAWLGGLGLDELGPDLVPVVGTEILPSHCTAGLLLDDDAPVERNGARAICPIADVGLMRADRLCEFGNRATSALIKVGSEIHGSTPLFVASY